MAEGRGVPGEGGGTRVGLSPRRDAEAVKERERLQQADAEKTDRLRALRLAKEAAEKEALAFKAAQPKPAAGRRKRTAAA